MTSWEKSKTVKVVAMPDNSPSPAAQLHDNMHTELKRKTGVQLK